MGCCCGGDNSTVTFGVQGMSCGHCKMAVEKALNNLEGVNSAEVNLDAANVTVTFDSSKVSEDQLKATVNEAGYTAE